MTPVFRSRTWYASASLALYYGRIAAFLVSASSFGCACSGGAGSAKHATNQGGSSTTDASGGSGVVGGTQGASSTGGSGGAAATLSHLETLQRSFVDLRFGMFLHFGILTYTGTWGKPNLDIAQFNPTALAPEQWADAAVSAKMKYDQTPRWLCALA